jgi:hypothetical protein
MRSLISIFILLVSLLNSGCAIYEKETTNRGGYLDYVLDEHWLKADSKAMRALRAFAMQVSLARVASVSAKNESDRQLLAIRIGALTKRFLPIYMCAFGKNPLAVPGAEADPCFYYDSAMVDYSTGLFDLAMIALPIEDGQKLVTTITGSFVNPINIADLLNTLLQIGKDALKYGRVVGALYRDTVELEVQLWLNTPQVDNRPSPYQVTVADVTPLYNIYIRGNDDMPAWIAEMSALRGRGLEPIPQSKFFYELGGLMSYICNLITSDATTQAACKKNLPSPTVNPAPVMGPTIPFRIGEPIMAGGNRNPGKTGISSGGSGATPPSSQPKGSAKPGDNQGNGSTVSNDVVQACLTVQNDAGSTGDQKALCKFIGNDATRAGKANAALQGALSANPVVLPSTTRLADVLSRNDQPPFETIRDAMIQTLGIKKQSGN